jgi:hypothetical protein
MLDQANTQRPALTLPRLAFRIGPPVILAIFALHLFACGLPFSTPSGLTTQSAAPAAGQPSGAPALGAPGELHTVLLATRLLDGSQNVCPVSTGSSRAGDHSSIIWDPPRDLEYISSTLEAQEVVFGSDEEKQKDPLALQFGLVIDQFMTQWISKTYKRGTYAPEREPIPFEELASIRAGNADWARAYRLTHGLTVYQLFRESDPATPVGSMARALVGIHDGFQRSLEQACDDDGTLREHVVDVLLARVSQPANGMLDFSRMPEVKVTPVVAGTCGAEVLDLRELRAGRTAVYPMLTEQGKRVLLRAEEETPASITVFMEAELRHAPNGGTIYWRSQSAQTPLSHCLVPIARLREPAGQDNAAIEHLCGRDPQGRMLIGRVDASIARSLNAGQYASALDTAKKMWGEGRDSSDRPHEEWGSAGKVLPFRKLACRNPTPEMPQSK